MAKQIIPISEDEARLPFPELGQLLDDRCAPAKLESAPWNEGQERLPVVEARIAYSPDCLVVKFDVGECEFRVAETVQPAAVWEDSCVEFFVEPEKGLGYYNFEFNAAGILHLAFGTARHGREMAPEEVERSVVREVMFLAAKKGKPYCYSWMLIARIPYSAFFRHQFVPRSEKIIRGNFYKCGDKMAHPSYQSWKPVGTPTPDFHQPLFFGELEIM